MGRMRNTSKTATKTTEMEGEVAGTKHMQLVHKLLMRFIPPELRKTHQEGKIDSLSFVCSPAVGPDPVCSVAPAEKPLGVHGSCTVPHHSVCARDSL